MGKYKILMIDDETSVLTAFKFYAEMKGDYEVLIAESGVEGLAAAKKNKPDVITLDVLMGKEDGVEVLRKIRSDESIKDIPVIMMSGVETEAARKTAKELGIEGFLAKPVEMEDLLHRINIIKAKNSIDHK
jgi:two-component system alkaline phosphatase synthesis response regulator PhoP